MRVMKVLPKRLEKYKLTLHPYKMKLIELKCESEYGNRSFDFLGFTHLLGKSQKGKAVILRKTISKKFSNAIMKTEKWIKENRHLGINQLIKELNVKMRGHYNYYGITFNSKKISSYYYHVTRILHIWLNRRGGKSKWNWASFVLLINKWIPLLRPKIYHKVMSAKPI